MNVNKVSVSIIVSIGILVVDHGGIILFVSAEGRGTYFSHILPIKLVPCRHGITINDTSLSEWLTDPMCVMQGRKSTSIQNRRLNLEKEVSS